MKDRRKPDLKYVLVAKEKHGTYYYDATGDALYEAAYKLFLERLEQGWYPTEIYYKDLGDRPYTKEQLAEIEEKFPELAKAAKSDVMHWLHKDASNKEIQGVINTIDRILTNEDKVAAWDFLQVRADYEYEEVRLAELL